MLLLIGELSHHIKQGLLLSSCLLELEIKGLVLLPHLILSLLLSFPLPPFTFLFHSFDFCLALLLKLRLNFFDLPFKLVLAFF